MSTFAERLSFVISTAAMTKTKFAERINVSQPFLSQLCSGSKSPSDRTIKDICREFGVDELWLRTGIGEAFSVPTREEEMTKLFKSLMADRPETFRRRAITALLRFSSDSPEWELLENIYNSIKEEAPDP